jgi:glycosyltransferase involved in cell wall biosynthesis
MEQERTTPNFGVVVIGRNEGERLERCLDSLKERTRALVYVDSGSTDGSVALARFRGAAIVELDMSIPFTAARARNAGFDHLMERYPGIAFVQFVDGDCEVVKGWLGDACQALEAGPDVAVVCGRRSERHPDASIYNLLCDIEWDTPVGVARSCGGDAMIRASAFLEAGRYDPVVIAGEEPELCVRLRQRGWKILRIDAPMTIHDAAMYHVGGWWKRAIRCGYAFALGAQMHGAAPEYHFIRERRRAVFWGFLLPVLALASMGFSWPVWGFGLLVLVVYPLQMVRIYRDARRRGVARTGAKIWAISCVLQKLPEFCGLCYFLWLRWRKSSHRIIEYK